jgi:hypothetical protein
MPSLFTLQPGQWYIQGTCAKCGHKLTLFPDLSEGTSKLFGSYWLVCPDCNQQREFQPVRYFHPISDG